MEKTLCEPAPLRYILKTMQTRSANLTYDAVILGAGASGLMCATAAAARGRRTLILDHAPKPGMKLSITGGGKCNLTNRRISPADYLSENSGFCHSALARFTPKDLLDLVERGGVAIDEREHGQLFCRRSAKDLTRYLVRQCADAGCHFSLGEKLLETGRLPARGGGESPRFFVSTSARSYATRSLVIALGSPARPQTGATGRGYDMARCFGHRIVPIRPALVGLVISDADPGARLFSGLAGISIPASIAVASASESEAGIPGKAPDKKKTGRHMARIAVADNLDLLFTHNGISGPAALQASLYWERGRRLIFDLLPGQDARALCEAPGAGKKLCRTLFRGILPDRLCGNLVPETLGQKKTAELSRADRDWLRNRLQNFEITPRATEGFAKAEVAAGGVSTGAVSSKTMESLRVPGLFFCGEVLDVTGRLGGYNLHWAFASGKAAGENI